MKKDQTFDWKSLETKLNAGLQQAHNHIQLNDTPFYPLAFHAEMPENYAFENGHLSFRFRDFALSALNNTTLNIPACKDNGQELTVAMQLNDAALKGRYEINAKYAGKITLDTAGNMRELEVVYDPRTSGEAGTSDSDVQPLTQDEIDAMVTQARNQRDPIQGTTHGPALMSTYNEHSESYNTAFVTSARLRELWSAGGATTQMSRDTHDALNNSTIVNSPDKVYANGNTYNYNAASQQTNIAFALKIMSIQANNDGNTALGTKYNNAAKAAASFKETVNQTGDGTQPGHLTGPQVYDKLNDTTLNMIQLSDEQFNNMIDQAYDENSQEGGADVAAMEKGWRILSGDERKMIRERMFLFQEELTAIKSMQPELLWAGDCLANLNGLEAVVTLTYSEQTAAWNVRSSQVTLPGFYIEVDDKNWTGKTAGIVRERLASMHFVKSLLQTKIQSGIQSMLEKAVLQSLLSL